MESTTTKNCRACGHLIRGRSDKKFCNDYCRNGFNNQLKAPTENNIRNINHQLLKNRRILEAMLPLEEKMVIVGLLELTGKGFNEAYHTQTKTTATGNTQYFCYDLGFFKIENEKCVIVRNT
jgi:hypothetical protein